MAMTFHSKHKDSLHGPPPPVNYGGVSTPPLFFEDWNTIKARHLREKIELVQAYSAHFPRREVSKLLGIDMSYLIRFANKHGITFEDT